MAKREVKQVPISLTLPIAELAEALKHLGASVEKPGKKGMVHYTEGVLVDFDGVSINMVTTDGRALTCYRVADCPAKMIGQVLFCYHRLLDYCKLFMRLYRNSKAAIVVIDVNTCEFRANGEVSVRVLRDDKGVKFPPYQQVLAELEDDSLFFISGKLMANNIRDLGAVKLYHADDAGRIAVRDCDNEKIRRVVMTMREG